MVFGTNKWEPDNECLEKLGRIFEEIFAYTSEKQNAPMLEMAREQYQSRVGKPFEDDHDFVQRMNTFLEWFIFDFQPEGGIPGSVFTSYMERVRHNSTTDEMILRMEISKNRHSLFHVIELRGNVVKVKDLVFRKTYHVTHDDNLEEDDVLESRIVVIKKKSFFTNTHCLHPKFVLDILKKAVRNVGRDMITPDFFIMIESMQLKWRRSRQIDVKHIYKFG
jgi:hypothetical protein